MKLLLDFFLPLASLTLTFVTGTIAGVDLAETRRARRDLADAEKIRAAIRNGYEPELTPETLLPRRHCNNGPEHCLCELCAPTEYEQHAA